MDLNNFAMIPTSPASPVEDKAILEKWSCASFK
jgi:hypothetical protein